MGDRAGTGGGGRGAPREFKISWKEEQGRVEVKGTKKIEEESRAKGARRGEKEREKDRN